MSARQKIHEQTLSRVFQPRRSPSGQVLLATTPEQVLGGLHLVVVEEHPELVGRVCVVSYLHTQSADLCCRLLSRAMSAGVSQGAMWLVVECEVDEALFRRLGSRRLQTSHGVSQVFYLRDLPGSWSVW
jgi:hypothetical protein